MTTPMAPTDTFIPTTTVDSTAIPYIRANQTEMVARNLRPGRPGYFFIDTLNVNQFVQNCSELNIKTGASTSNDVTVHYQGDGIYCNTTHAYATVVGTSQTGNNTIYINENYVTLNVHQVGANVNYTSSNTSDYLPGDIVYQVTFPSGFGNYYTTSANGAATTNTQQISPYYIPNVSRSFVGRVKYWSPADAALVVEPLSGTPKANASSYTNANVYTVIYKMSDNRIAYVESIPQGDKFPNNGTFLNVTQNLPITGNTANAHIHRSGQLITSNTADQYGNTIITSANVSSSIVGNYLFVTSGTGQGSIGKVLSVSANKRTIYLDNSFTTAGDSRYSIGFPIVDENGTLCSILHIPEYQQFNLISGTRNIIITDTPTVNDVTGSMRAMAFYKASASSVYDPGAYVGTPVLPGAPVLDPSRSPVKPVDPSLRGSTSSPLVVEANTSYGATTYQSDNDPLAQIFKTPKSKNLRENYGIFVSSIDLWFKNKPTGSSPKLPVVVKLVTTNNGYPTSTILGSSSVEYSKIKISNAPDSANIGSTVANNTTSTKFTFDDPIYLQPDTEYGIVVQTESPDYQLFVSDIGSYDISFAGATSSILINGSPITNLLYTYLTQNEAFTVSDALLFNNTVKAAIAAGNTTLRDTLIQSILSQYRSNNPVTTTNITYYAVDPVSGNVFQMTNLASIQAQSKVSAPPSVGSFFVAQNSSVWTPLNNQMLMFVVNKAQFTTSPVVMQFNANSTPQTEAVDKLIFNADYYNFPSSKINYGLYTTSLDPTTNLFKKGSVPTVISPKQQINFGNELKALTGDTTKQKYILAGNNQSMTLEVTMQTSDPDVTPIFNSERLSAIIESNIIDDATITTDDIAVIDSINLSGETPSTLIVTIDPPYLSDGIPATAEIQYKDIVNGKLQTVTVTNPGSGYIKTPNITIKKADGVTVAANAVIAGEDKKYNGNATCRYQTRKIILADGFDAGDLRVWIDGIIPQGTGIYVYYKVQSSQDSDDFINKNWQLMDVVKDYRSPDNQTAIELSFAPKVVNDQPTGVLSYTENNISYPLGGNFKYFAIKIVMTAQDQTVCPTLLNLRMAAYPAG